MNSGDLERFESFRRERNRRRLEGGPTRHLGKQASVLRELEEAENREIRNQQLTREVQEFFEEATRTAASIVSQVAETAEEQLQRTVADEMSEFLTATIRRAQEFVQLVRTSGGEVSNTELTANLHNIVGPKLDEFRFEGDAATAEHHVGRDPFAIRTDGPPADVSTTRTMSTTAARRAPWIVRRRRSRSTSPPSSSRSSSPRMARLPTTRRSPRGRIGWPATTTWCAPR